MRAQGDNKNTTHRCTRSTVSLFHTHVAQTRGSVMASKCNLCNFGCHDASVGFLSSIREPQTTKDQSQLEHKYTPDPAAAAADMMTVTAVVLCFFLALTPAHYACKLVGFFSFFLSSRRQIAVRLKQSLCRTDGRDGSVSDRGFFWAQRLLHQIQQDARALPARQRLQRANHHGKLSHRGDHVSLQICEPLPPPVSSPWQRG